MRNLEDRLIRLEGNFGFIPHECSFVDIDTGVPRAEDGDTVVRGTRCHICGKPLEDGR